MTIKRRRCSRADVMRCRTRLDRVIFSAQRNGELPEIPGFRVKRDRGLRRTTAFQYRRIRVLEHPLTGTTIFIYYKPTAPWMSPVKVAAFPADKTGFQRGELESIVTQFDKPEWYTLETAFDFETKNLLDIVRRHCLFGKSQPVPTAHGDLRYGTRKSAKLVRSYRKNQIKASRIEVEAHSSLIRTIPCTSVDDLQRLPGLLYPAHIRFVSVDWSALFAYLSRKGMPADRIRNEARRHEHSIHELLKFLRSVGVLHVHRFLRPHPMNAAIEQALTQWAREWKSSGQVGGGQ